MFYWLLKHVFAGPILRRLFGPDVEGAQNLPRDKGPVIFASNHLSVIDSFLLPLILKRRIYFLAKSEYFTGKGIKGKLTRWFFLSTGMRPLGRQSLRSSVEDWARSSEPRRLAGYLSRRYPQPRRSPVSGTDRNREDDSGM